MEEVRQHLLKKKTGKRKRGAGWDIVVDWVPQEQPAGKRSKIEKELGFDFDSSFGCSINVGEARRSRRSNTKYRTSEQSSPATATATVPAPAEKVKNTKAAAEVMTNSEDKEKSER